MIGLKVLPKVNCKKFFDNRKLQFSDCTPRVWNGFKSVENKFSIIANCSDIPHGTEEMSRKPFDDPYFNYNWNIKLG